MKDSQSDSNRAATVAGDLINNDGVDIMMVASTPDTVRAGGGPVRGLRRPLRLQRLPVAGVLLRPQAATRRTRAFKWTYHSFWGSESAAAVFMDHVGQLDDQQEDRRDVAERRRRQRLGRPEDGHADASGGPPATRSSTPAGTRTAPRTSPPQIGKFKAADCRHPQRRHDPAGLHELLEAGLPAGLQAAVATIAKALLFPSALEALGDIGYGLTTEVWWTPQPPVQVVAHRPDAASRSPTPTSRPPASSGRSRSCTTPCSRSSPTPSSAPRTSTTRRPSSPPIKATDIETISGPVDLERRRPNNPVQNVSITPLVGGQWVKGDEVPVRPQDRRQLYRRRDRRPTAELAADAVLSVTDPTRVPSRRPRTCGGRSDAGR